MCFCLVLYANTFHHSYAMDDELVILKNLNVQKGLAGLKDIFTTDAYQGYYDMMGAASPLAGGRYRPLSIATFAIEQEIFGQTLGDEYINVQKELLKAQRQNTSAGQMNALVNKKKKLEIAIANDNLKIANFRHIFRCCCLCYQ